MRSEDIRRTFLDFFEERDHRIWPSSSLIPNDPTMLLTIAGMVQFKPYLSGETTPPHRRAASVQKCARTNDIENVGVTTRHFTVFEMLGNWSFGEYFKREAIAWSWELSTKQFGFDPQRLWATVHTGDDESERLWLEETDIPTERIQRLGDEDNFWDTGAAGPCGPSSELHFDRGPAYGKEGGPAVDGDRYLEFWNLVFMQYERDDAGNILGELPAKNVDTGMGLERMAMLLQDVPNVFETDVVRPMLDRAQELTGVGYGRDVDSDISLRVIAEHARAATFLIADGVLPSNEGRGYILRRLLRRVVRHTRLLGSTRPVMGPMTETVIETLGGAYPEMQQQRELVTRITQAEEENFGRTLRSGLTMLDTEIAKTERAGSTTLSGDAAFTLHDTYGFPVELTLEIASEHGLDLDREAFAVAMEAQRERARAATKAGGPAGENVSGEVYRAAASKTGLTRFTGYSELSADSRIGAIVLPGGLAEAAQEGDEVEVVLAQTPFYAESGGQLGDHGEIVTDTGRLKVTDTVSPVEGLVVHRAKVIAGEVRAGQEAHASVDAGRRTSITRGHTATHILHATVQEVLGGHARQAGSAIDQGRFRFDFPNFEPLGLDRLSEVEHIVNDRVARDDEITSFETTHEEARAMGATALFGEKYGEVVRIVRIGDYSLEFCGGTHVEHTAQVGSFTILTEGSVAANVRRVEAITGPEAFAYLSRERMVAEQVSRMLKVPSDEVVDKVDDLLGRLRLAEKELAQSRQQALLATGDQLLAEAETVGDRKLIGAVVEDADRDGLKTLATDLRNRISSGAVVLGAGSTDGKALLVCAVTTDLDVNAADILRPGAQVAGGGAGGKGDLAQAGGKDGSKLPEAIATSVDVARGVLNG